MLRARVVELREQYIMDDEAWERINRHLGEYLPIGSIGFTGGDIFDIVLHVENAFVVIFTQSNGAVIDLEGELPCRIQY